jgi:hypothetical protein
MDYLRGMNWEKSLSERQARMVSWFLGCLIMLMLIGWLAGQNISASDMAILRAFALKVESHMTDKTFAKLPYAFPEEVTL